MALTIEDLLPLIARLERSGRGDFHRPENFDLFRNAFVTSISDSLESRQNALVLEQLRDRSIEQRRTLSQEFLANEGISREIRGALTIGAMGEILIASTGAELTTMDQLGNIKFEETLFGSRPVGAGPKFEAGKRFLLESDDSFTGRVARPFVGGVIRGFSNIATAIPGVESLGGEELKDFRADHDTSVQAGGLTSQIFSGVGHLVPFFFTAGGIGAAIGARTLLAPLPLTVAGALTAEPGERVAGAIGGLVAGVVGGIAVRLAAPISAKATGAAIRAFGDGAVARVFTQRVIPQFIEGIGEVAGFTGLSAIEQYIHNDKVDWRIAFGTTVGIIGLLKAARFGKTELGAVKRRIQGRAIIRPQVAGRASRINSARNLFRRREAFLKRGDSEVASLEQIKDALRKGRTKLGRLEPYEIEIAARLADKSRVMTLREAEAVVEQPEVARAAVAADMPIQHTPSGFLIHARRLEVLTTQGRIEGFDPLTEVLSGRGLSETELKVFSPKTEQRLVEIQERAGDQAIQAASRGRDATESTTLARQVRDVRQERVFLGVREALLARAEQMGTTAMDLALRGKHTEARNMVSRIMELRKQASQATPLREFRADKARDLRALADELEARNPLTPEEMQKLELGKVDDVERIMDLKTRIEQQKAKLTEVSSAAEGATEGSLKSIHKTASRIRDQIVADESTLVELLAPRSGGASFREIQALRAEASRLEKLSSQSNELDDLRVFTDDIPTELTAVKIDGPTPAEQIVRVKQAEQQRTIPDAQDVPVEQPAEIEFIPGRPFSKRPLTAKQTVIFGDWVKKLKGWYADGQPGQLPTPPTFVRRRGRRNRAVFDVLEIVKREHGDPVDVVNAIAAKVVVPDSVLARMMKSNDPLIVAEALKMALEGKLMPPATQEIKINPSERGSFDLGVFGLGRRKDSLKVELPSGTEAVSQAKIGAQEVLDGVLETLKGRAPPNVEGLSDFYRGDGVVFHNPSPGYDRLRRQNPIVRKLIDAPWADGLVKFIRQQRHSHTVRSALVREWLVETVERPLKSYLEGMPTPESRVKAMERLINLREGAVRNELDLSRMDPKEVAILNSLDKFFTTYREALVALGIPVRGKEYFPHLRDAMKFIYKENPDAVETIEQVTSRFTRHRLKENSAGIVTDIFRVVETYAGSIERMLAWQPVADTINSIRTFYGVEGSRVFPGDKKARSARLPKMPKAQSEWWDHQIKIWQGTPGSLSKAMENFADFVWDRTGGRFLPETKGRAGKAFLSGWLTFNYIGAFAGSVSAGFKNLTQNMLTINELGPRWWWKGVKEFTLRRSSGEYEFNVLLDELGVMDASFMKNLGTNVKAGLRGKISTGWKNLNEALFFFFERAEWINRGVAGLSGYRKAEAFYSKAENGGLKGEALHRKALEFGREMIGRTQFDFDAMTGGQAFSGTAGKLLGQFARFNINAFDYLQLVVRRGLGSKSAHRQAPLLPGERGLFQLLMTLSAPFMVTGGLNLIGISQQETEAPGGILPEPAKFLGKTVVEGGARLLTSKTLESSGFNDPFTGNPFMQPKGRKLARTIGFVTFSDSPLHLLYSSLGPAVRQITSIAAIPFKRGAANEREIKAAFRIIAPTVQGGRVLRFMRENRDGFVRGRGGRRLFPEDRELTGYEKFLRLMGFSTPDMQTEMDLISDTRATAEILDASMSELRRDILDRLVAKEDIDEVFAHFLNGLNEITRQTFRVFDFGDANREWKQIKKTIRDFDARTDRRKILSQERFGDIVPR